jgi:selenocysteine lyase/cysteine desulfurase
MPIKPTAIDAEFGLRDDIIYLNHAAVAPWPQRTVTAVTRFAQENASQGSQAYPRWLQVESALREQMRQLINAPAADDIALLKNTSEALSVVAFGLDWQAGDNIVSFSGEFPSNRVVWEALSARGVTLRLADINHAESPEEALFACVDERTRLIAISSVQYASGLRADLEKVGAFCRQRQILFCVDAIQSIGALQFDVEKIAADFVMADGHKWMLGPEGLALFYCRREWREQLQLTQYGWHMTDAYVDFDRQDWQPANSARRFECGSPNMLGIHALNASLSLLLEVGMAEVEKRVLANTQHLLQLIHQHPQLEVLTDEHPERRSGIVTFGHRNKDHAELFAQLTEKGVMCAQRGGGIRFSPHFYTPTEKLTHAVQLAATLGG